MAKKNSSEKSLMDTIMGLCKRRGFVFQTSEIYGGLNGFFDYGPLGVEMKKNIKDAWWKDMVQRRDDVVGLDSSIVQHPKTWEASGHIEGFSDPLVDCKESKMRYRADQLFYARVSVEGTLVGYLSLLEEEAMQSQAEAMADRMKRKNKISGKLDPIILKEFSEAQPEEYSQIPSPATGKPGSLTAPRDFNLMFETHIGAISDASSVAYLRPETAQGIFSNFKNVIDTGRLKLPFGIAQIGKAFRNEITPRNFVFRSREFEQMEIEYFISGEQDTWKKHHREWIDTRINWFNGIGLEKDAIREDIHPNNKLAHYAQACTDLMVRFPHGWQELEGIAARGNFDLKQHQNASGKRLEYFDENNKDKFLPHVIEPSLGVDRTFLALLTHAYCEEEIEGDRRTVLKLHPRIAPIKAAVFPLVKNKPELVVRAQKLYRRLQKRWNVFYDASGAIGRRYRRMDEVGTPYGITIDFDTIEKDGSITLRDRDTLKQNRLSEDELVEHLSHCIEE